MSLCDRHRQAIECAETHEEQVETLIDIVSRQPDSTFEQLLDALKATNQTEAVDIITETHKESVQKHAVCIMYTDDNSADYKTHIIISCVDTLKDRREVLTERFFKKDVLSSSSLLH